mgnify:CR=1 FL=1
MSPKNHTEPRLHEIHQWLNQVLNTTDYHCEPASSDASFRRYFRVSLKGETWVLMDAPPSQEDIQPFIDIASFLYQNNVHVPEIKAQDLSLGFVLLSDFGHKAYLDEFNHDLNSVDTLYPAAIDSIVMMQLSQPTSLPSYNRNLLQQELSLFPDWFLGKHLGIETPDFLQNIFDILINNALEQEQVFVHRDYHSRNLMNTTDNSPGIIDFQDAVIGPISYDLVSLLRDCYISWSDDKVASWIAYYVEQAQQHDLLNTISVTQFTRWFDLMGLQRHIKVLGIFCRLKYRDGKDNYINDLPLTLHYAVKISKKYPEFNQLHGFLINHPQINTIL